MIDLIHIGMQKCASTYLQQNVFGEHPDIDLLRGQSKDIARTLTAYNLEYSDESVRKRVSSCLEDKSPGAKTIWSYEGFCGDMITGRGGLQTMERLGILFGRDQRILFIIRNQLSIIMSIWKQYVRNGGTYSLKNFMTHHCSPALSTPYCTIYDKVLYDRYITRLYEVFTPGNVKTILFEDIVAGDGVKQILDFIGVSTDFEAKNKATQKLGLSYPLANIWRFFNLFFVTRYGHGVLFPYKFHESLKKFFLVMNSKLYFRSQPEIESMIPSCYLQKIRDSNQKTSDLLGIDLHEKGYPQHTLSSKA